MKQININIPKGYEINIEASDFTKGEPMFIYVHNKWQDLFDKFLMENDIYKAYIVNAKGLKARDPYKYISGAFIWDYTAEGYSFWLDINNRWRKIVLSEESKSQIEKNQPKPNNVGCSFCNGKSEIESTGVKIRLLKNKSTLEVEIDTLCYMCDENISGYSEFNIKYCPMCGNKLTNN